ncbi:hypothetical protein [Parablautia sp. Marseille-Q6255]|uniref:hypothetical protein n=1 Tax=Parablautia sp. Marseille-Q6255 TaxID=3039593 RepID=UPI0024BBFEEE|nr:hypothetical protein [Parablautia sp. Marseille-Q6255]
MIQKPQGYDESWAFTGETRTLPAGCYVCVVKKAAAVEENGKNKLVVLFDIAEGEQKDFYKSQYDAARANSSDAKWRGVHKQIMNGSSLPFFKGLMTSIEKSNPGYTFPWGVQNNEKTLTGKKFGAVMGREQFQAQDGSLKWATKIIQIRSIEGLKDAETPEDKLYSDTQQARNNTPYIGGVPQHDTGFVNVPESMDEELPFN